MTASCHRWHYVAGVERLARYDHIHRSSRPDALDADPVASQYPSPASSICATGARLPHDPLGADPTRITAAAPADAEERGLLWSQFLLDITQGDADLSAYLQRLAGYCATGVTSEDILPYLFGVGSNGKSSFAEALTAALGDYALVFAPEVMMEAKGERHPTELAQFMGVRLCAVQPSPCCSSAVRVKVANRRRQSSPPGYARATTSSFRRAHKTPGRGQPYAQAPNAVSPAIRRRMQMVPFRAVFAPVAGQGMRERLQKEALGAVLAWAI